MRGLAILAWAFAFHALLAGRLDRLPITAPMVFVLMGGVLGPGGTGLLKVSFSNETTLAITEITLALLLFADASTVRIRDVEGDASLPRRLLFIGLPLTVMLGTVLALSLMGLGMHPGTRLFHGVVRSTRARIRRVHSGGARGFVDGLARAEPPGPGGRLDDLAVSGGPWGERWFPVGPVWCADDLAGRRARVGPGSRAPDAQACADQTPIEPREPLRPRRGARMTAARAPRVR